MTTTTLSPTNEREQTIGRWAFISSLASVPLGQLAALARYRTEDGKSDLDLTLTEAWATPAGKIFEPLLDWADPDFVYFTYNKFWLPVVVLMTVVAFIAYRQRSPEGFEKWAWRFALTGYTMTCVAAFLDFWTQWGSEPNALFEPAFVFTIPAFLIALLGSTVLGITLLIKKFAPRTTAILLTLALPGLFVIPLFTELGNVLLPGILAFGFYGRRLALT